MIAVVPVELRGVPYLLFNKQSLSRLATAVGKPLSLAHKTERKENFEVAKIWVIINLQTELPKALCPSAPTHSRGVGVPVNSVAAVLKRRSRSAESKGRKTSRPSRSTRQWRAVSSKSSMEPPNLIENATAAKTENDITATQASETASEDASFQDQEGMRVPEITEANEAIEANEATEGGEA
ncbi:hypothetical protein F2Q69_00056107 [Brassica cretica]|uniref:DUF4283 domain-containing protein n=1 Tax=Brassica cretica TaxID=69181 RepID=A0A8S9NA89_BRACR|nr:hypothetical protein F2Q69_00056107 [Brassica cretica]